MTANDAAICGVLDSKPILNVAQRLRLRLFLACGLTSSHVSFALKLSESSVIS